MNGNDVYLVYFKRTAFSRSRPKDPERDVFNGIRMDEAQVINGSLRMFMTGVFRSRPVMPDCRSTWGLLEGVFKL